MAELARFRFPGGIQPNTHFLHGTIEIGAAGVIANQTGNRACGVTWLLNAAGDYRATIHRAYRRFMFGDAALIFPALGTVPTLAAGNDAAICGVSSAQALGTANIGSFGLVTYRTDSDVLIAPTNGAFVAWYIVLSDSP